MAQPSIYESGDKYGHLTLTGKAYRKIMDSGSNQLYVECICVCGKIWFTQFRGVKNGSENRSCGCKVGDVARKTHTKNGTALYGNKHPLYNVYYAMKARCYNDKDAGYPNYGGRGVVICNEWLTDFMIFFNWANSQGWRKGLSIDRIDVNGNYEPINCRLVDMKVQSRNKRNNVNITAFGETKCAWDWSLDPRCVVKFPALVNRVKKFGWEPEYAITAPKRHSSLGRKKII